MPARDIVIENPRGLHVRVAAEIVKIARQHGAQVRICGEENREASADSIIELLMLDAPVGTALRIEAEGHHAQAVVNRISELFTDGAGI